MRPQPLSVSTLWLFCILCGLLLRHIQAFKLHKNGKKSVVYLPRITKLRDSKVQDSSVSVLPEKLQTMVNGLRSVRDEKMRYQQLLFLAGKAKAMPDQYKIPENKVPGCLSTVYVHADLGENGSVQYLGDSDSQLTKGLVTFLIDGLSGCTPEEIQAIQPDFIKDAGIAQSLTPGRNNGFLNMLNVMKKKAAKLAEKGSSTPSSNSAISTMPESSLKNDRPIYTSIISKLQLLQPTALELVDESAKHAGHAGIQGIDTSSGETHFKVLVVAPCFEQLSLVQRHKMIYTLLSAEMNNGVHALSISAKAPSEV